MKTFAALFLSCFFMASVCSGQDISEEDQKKLDTIASLMDKAGSLFVDGEFKRSASRVRAAQSAIQKLVKEGKSEVVAMLEKDCNRIQKARELLVAKGEEFKAFAGFADLVAAAENSETMEGDGEQVSFSTQVAPILVQHCGQCHVRGARGEFSAANFVSLKRGTPNGAVIKDGDPGKSALIQLIESGDMPPRGKVPAEKLKVLKDWVKQGAKFDGENKEMNLAELARAAQQSGNQGSGNRNTQNQGSSSRQGGAAGSSNRQGSAGSGSKGSGSRN